MTCYQGQSAFGSGTLTRVYINTGTPTSIIWSLLDGETDSGFDNAQETLDSTDKDSPTKEEDPIGYEWSASATANWNWNDPAQARVREAILLMEKVIVAWRPAGLTNGYYGPATVKWSSKAPNRQNQTFEITFTGSGELCIS